MADQLAGQWYADATGLGDLLPADRVDEALRTIHATNVRRFGGGRMGAVIGMRPDGTVWFRTPEAYDERGDFRASIYLRPLAIWAIEEALRRRARNGAVDPEPTAAAVAAGLSG